MSLPAFSEHAPLAKAEIRDLNGAPGLYIDGKPFFPTMIMAPWHLFESTAPGQVKLRAEAEAGFELHSTCDELTLSDFGKMWRGPGQYNYDIVDAKLKSIREFHPNAYVFFKLYVQPPRWWVEAHPDEWVHYATGYEPDRSQGISVNNGAKDATLVSYASKIWLEDASRMLENFIAHLATVPGGERVVGINVMNGHCQEWHYWGSIFGHEPDTGPAMTSHFRDWLRAKYQGQANLLQAAWHDPAASFENAQVPGLEPRMNTKGLYFRDPLQEAPVIDYYKCQHELTADVLIHLCRVVKESSGSRILSGAYYGYLFHCPWYPDGLSLEMQRVLASPYVDFLAAPPNYNDYISRGLGGDALLRGLPESVKSHGKLYISESDEGAYLADRLHRPCEKVDSWEESIANTRRIFCQILLRNIGNWWWDWEDNGGLYVPPENVQCMKELKSIGDASLQTERSSAAETALVYSLETLYYTSHTKGMATWDILDIPTHALARAGIPFDIITTTDLGCESLPKYKFLIFPQLFYCDSELRERIHGYLKTNKATALWVYAPGYVTPEGLSLDAMAKLTGIRFSKEDQERLQEIELLPSAHPIVKDFDPLGKVMSFYLSDIGKGDENRVVLCEDRAKFRIGTHNSLLGPTFWADDVDCTALGSLSGASKPGFVVKQLPDWTSIYLSAIPSSPAVVQRIAAHAGVHIYNPSDDVFMCSRSYIALITGAQTGQRQISLPGLYDVEDVFGKNIAARNSDRFEVNLTPKNTFLFGLKKAEAAGK